VLLERFFYDELPTEEEKLQLKARLSKTEFNYHQAAFEIYITEADFVTDMQIIKEVFLEPMEKQFSKHLSQSIFTENFIPLLKVHQAMQANIWSLRDGPFAKDGLGDLFLKQVLAASPWRHLPRTHISSFQSAQASVFESYSPYFINYPAALQLIEKKKKEKESFAHFIKNCEQHPLCRKLKFESFLLKPIQRVMKYPLLIRVCIPFSPFEFFRVL